GSAMFKCPFKCMHNEMAAIMSAIAANDCLLDSGSEVSTLTESFFNRHFKPKGKTLTSTSGWLSITEANGLEIPYLGYFEADIEVLGKTIEKRGFLVVKDPTSPTARQRKERIPGLLGMNVQSKANEKARNNETSTPWLNLGPVWSEAITQTQCKQRSSVLGLVRVAGRKPVRVPANSVTTIAATG
ncbi:hypothetical protein AC249_AIPGENE18710, partial [Exaiptasia diaphana]